MPPFKKILCLPSRVEERGYAERALASGAALCLQAVRATAKTTNESEVTLRKIKRVKRNQNISNRRLTFDSDRQTELQRRFVDLWNRTGGVGREEAHWLQLPPRFHFKVAPHSLVGQETQDTQYQRVTRYMCGQEQVRICAPGAYIVFVNGARFSMAVKVSLWNVPKMPGLARRVVVRSQVASYSP